MRTPPLDFKLLDEEGLLCWDEPHLFVDLSVEPVVFTVRGIAHLAPRFKHVGVDIASIRTAADFDAAVRSWRQVEEVLLQEHIAARAAQGGASNPHKALMAIYEGDDAAFEMHLAALEHRKRANLTLVR